MTKLEWRETAPPCEKKSHLRLSITFHFVAVRFSFSSCVSVAISNFGRLDISFDDFEISWMA